MSDYHQTLSATTVVAVRRNGKVAMCSDGQVTAGNMIVKNSAKKVHRLFNNKVLAGFAGSGSDAFSLFEKFEQKLQECNGQLHRAASTLAYDWITDKYLRKLEAQLLVADIDHILLINGNGDVLQPDEPILCIGSGQGFALAAGRALLENTSLAALEIAQSSIKIAGDICIYTNGNITTEELK